MSYLSQLEAQIIREMNQARANPGEYANKLESLKQYYDGRLFKQPGETPIATQEGISAVDEAIRALRAMDPRPSLCPSRGMSQAAADLVKDQGPRGETGHTGSDGSTPFDRMNRYGRWQGGAAENISYGSDTAEQVVMQLIIDDGVSSRGHRENIFNGEFRWTGVACGPHQTYRQMCAIAYAKGYEERE
ncbi:CAP domain-containing protein [Laspinema olomoucense]|uniref:CAP domain-containing protein n=1 Tax=Laspinema olomoucense D3b TaxID=2953688 RepID=A0ABT2N5G6_9CYAN|nr:CAP domain-containing protein [Laspinema sp. D3b]MCT7976995.1 CAP domain-containing protein [Laspinema sp. D3b]